MLEWVIIEIDADNERETDKNNAERHATVRNSSPNPARHTRKIFVTEGIGDSLQTSICNDHDLLEVLDFVKRVDDKLARLAETRLQISASTPNTVRLRLSPTERRDL